jgi:hypothetical protein
VGESAYVQGQAGAAYSCQGTNVVITSGAAGTFGPLGAELHFSVGSPGSISITCRATDPVTGEEGTAGTATAVAWPVAIPELIVAPATVTVGHTYVASVSALFGASYLWSLTNGSLLGYPTGTMSADGKVNSISFRCLAVGTCSVQVTETNGEGASGLPSTSNIQVVPEAEPVVLAGLPSTVTAGSSLMVMGTARGPGFSYLCSVAGGTLTGASNYDPPNGGFAIPVVAGSVPGVTMVVYCTETNAAGDSSATGMATAMITP